MQEVRMLVRHEIRSRDSFENAIQRELKEVRMFKGQFKTAAVLGALVAMAGEAGAAQCGNTAAGFEAWKRQFAEEARARGVSASTIAALAETNYATATISADRGQRSFRLSLDEFLAKRGGSTIIARGRALKQSNAALFASIEQRYGVPPGPLLAIWGMETLFGKLRGNQHTLSAVATLAYDCRRSAYFTDQLYATLTLIDRGILSAGTRGSMHGEIGQTQFMPKSILNYGTGGDLNTAAHALASTANFLRAHGWRAGAGYQPGEANFGAIQAWNAAPVYQRAIALIGQQIDGGSGRSASR
jgi:membrane-bound lytic murein transglycosylase B